MFVNFKKNKECHVYGPVCNSIVQRTPNKDYWRKCLVMICTMIFNPHKLLNNPQWFFVIKLVQNMDNGHVIRTFFKHIPNNRLIGAKGPNKLWFIWGISSWNLSILSLCVPSPWFSINQHLFLQKLLKKLLRH